MDSRSAPAVVVMGAGITGLSAAYELATRHVPFVLLEASDRTGGLVFTERIDGFTIEAGADSMLAQKPAAVRLCEELGLGPRLIPTTPPRRAYVDALAATLARSRDRTTAIESVRSAARERLARRAALGEGADDEAWIKAARAAGLEDDEARALLDAAGDEDGIAAGRALAHLSGGKERSGA